MMEVSNQHTQERETSVLNCTQEIGAVRRESGHVGWRVIEGWFDGGDISCDGGVIGPRNHFSQLARRNDDLRRRY